MTQTGEGYTPMVQQYMEIKKQHEDKLLFYRLGDFYELFFGDAITASRELNLTLTQRAGNTKHPAVYLFIQQMATWPNSSRRDIALPFATRWKIPRKPSGSSNGKSQKS